MDDEYPEVTQADFDRAVLRQGGLDHGLVQSKKI
jgi:hypothetical protein